MYSINGYDFQNEDDVDIAREELNKIQFISDKLSDDPEAVLAVYNKMLDSKIFITPIGVEYLRQIQGYLLAAALISLGVFLLKTVTHIIFSIIGFAAAAAVLYYVIFMR